MTTYYVSPSGSNANNGTTTGTPFLTLQKAASVVAPGDTVLVRGGTYALAAALKLSTAGTGNLIGVYGGPPVSFACTGGTTNLFLRVKVMNAYVPTSAEALKVRMKVRRD